MSIQRASIDAAEKILEIFTACKNTMELTGIFQWNETYPNLHTIINDIQNNELYILSNNGEIMGVICLNTQQEAEWSLVNWLDKNGHVLIIHRLAVHPLFQGQGFARQLMNFAENFASQSGYTSIRLDAYTGNKSALTLYERRDYQGRGEVVFSGRVLPFICFEKVIMQS